MKKHKRLILLSSICLMLLLAVIPVMTACAEEAPAPAPSPAPAPAPTPVPTPTPEPIHLTFMTFIPKDSIVSTPALWYVDEIQKRSKGELIIDYAGGPEAIPGRDQLKAMAEGVFDLDGSSAAYVQDILPESLAVDLSQLTPWEEEEVGFYDIMVELYEKINIRFIGRYGKGLNPYFYVLTNKRIQNRDELLNLIIVAGPPFNIVATKWDMTQVPVTPMETYSAMERGVVDAAVHPHSAVCAWGWHEVIPYVLDHPFWSGNQCIFMNLDSYNGLPKHLQTLMVDTLSEMQPRIEEWVEEQREKDFKVWADAGIEFIKFDSSADTEWFLREVYDVRWEDVITRSPETGPKLRELVSQ